ncbi:Aminotransferase class I and II, putative [Angomonas deanei]|uniref:Aminotransferase class I and II, putative n=1 Tax=Angomonas deanei TaxID=59799 RepID=A0A7G2C5Y3_9TRYP|nr:Aminotransferase class I and II, putative [Angomonas deanei]
MTEAVETTRCNGYTSSLGTPDARAAVAAYWTRWFAPSEPTKLTAADVILASGCSDALSIVMGALVGSGDRILLSQPLFPQYTVLADYYGVEPVFYDCDPSKEWEVDLVGLQALLDKDQQEGRKIKAMLINNPSNPCGSNWSRSHVEAVVKLCEANGIPLVSDEIYAGMTFDIHSPSPGASPFTSVADIASTATRFIVSGASKRFGVPGDRLGWILQVDPTGRGAKVFKGCGTLTGRFLLPHTVLQRSIIQVLQETDESYYNHALGVLKKNAAHLYEELRAVKGLEPVVPAGGMFMSVRLHIPDFKEEIQNGVDFAGLLAAEENVHVFPGDPFRMPNAFRLTISRPSDITEESTRRIVAFCKRHTQ